MKRESYTVEMYLTKDQTARVIHLMKGYRLVCNIILSEYKKFYLNNNENNFPIDNDDMLIQICQKSDRNSAFQWVFDKVRKQSIATIRFIIKQFNDKYIHEKFDADELDSKLPLMKKNKEWFISDVSDYIIIRDKNIRVKGIGIIDGNYSKKMTTNKGIVQSLRMKYRWNTNKWFWTFIVEESQDTK